MKHSDTFHRMNLLIPTVLFVLLFVMISGVLTLVFLRAAEASDNAQELTDAVQICRSAAEEFRADPAAFPETRGYSLSYDRAEETSAPYILRTQRTENPVPGGSLYHAVLRLYRDDRCIYTLEVTAFAQEGGYGK